MQLKSSVKLAGFGVIGIFIIISIGAFITPVQAPSGWTIAGNMVYINDTNVYLEANPHTITESGYVYFNLTTKSFTGNIDAVWGFDTDVAKPKSAEIYNPRTVNTTQCYTCAGASDLFFNYTLSPNHFQCWQNYTADNITYTNLLVFEHDFAYGNIPTKTACWYELTHEDWNDVSDRFNVEARDFGGMNKWYYVTNLPVVAGNNYQVRVLVDVPVSTNISGKYWFAVKPSAETLSQAISNNHLYYLDPWWNSTWGNNVPIVLTLPAAETNGVTKTNWQSWINVTYRTGMQTDFDDLRFLDSSNTIELPYTIWKKVDSQFAYVVVNVNSFNASNQSTVNMYYNNPTATSKSNKTATFIYADDFEAGASALNNYQLNDSDSFSITTNAMNGTYSINKTGYQGDVRIATYKLINYSVVQNGSVEMQWWSVDDDDSGWPGLFFGMNTTLGGQVCGGYGFMYADGAGGAEARIVKNYVSAGWATPCGAADVNLNQSAITKTPNLYHFAQGWWWKNGTMLYNLYKNDTTTLWAKAGPATDTTFTSGYFAIERHRQMRMDEIYVYKTPNPTYVFGSTQSNWMDNNWTYRKCINLTNPTGSNIYEFPLHLQLNSSNFDYSKAISNGSDLRFTVSSNDPTLLSYCRENWNTTGNSFVIVNTTALADNTTQICMYYGNTNATDVQNCSATYGSYNVTSLFSEGSGSNVADSKLYSNGTLQGTYTWNNYPNCKYGKCVSINGANGDQMNYTTNIPTGWTTGTILFWTKPNVALDGGAGIKAFLDSGQTADSGHGLQFIWRESTPRLEANIADGVTVNYNSNVASMDTNWHCVAVTWSTTTGGNLWFDGSKNASNSTNIAAPGGGLKTLLGNLYNINYPYNGSFDEVLFNNRKMSDAELYAMCGSQLVYALGTEESIGPVVVPSQGNITWTTPATNNSVVNNTYYIFYNATSNSTLTSCQFQINGTNVTGTVSGLNCIYNETISPQKTQTRCAIGYGYNATTNNVWFDNGLRCTNIVDTIKPTITIFSPANTTYNTTIIDINWTASEDINWAAYSINGGANQSFTTEWQYTGFSFATGFPVSLWGDEASWDGQYVWAVEEDQNYIKKFYVNGTGISQFNTVVSGGEYTRGVTQDGTYIWAINTNKKVYQYLMNGTPTGFNFSIAAVSDPFDLDTDGSYIYISDQYPRKVWIYYVNGTLSSSWTPTVLDTYSGGITKWGNYIWISNNYQLSDKIVFKFYLNGTYTGDNFTYTTSKLKTIDTNGIYFWGASDADINKKMFEFYFSAFQQANKSAVTFPQGTNLTICANDTSGNMNCTTQFFTVTVPPTITFVSQSPADINTFDLFGFGLNITYNITGNLNSSTTYLWHKTNTSTSECYITVNGSCTRNGFNIADVLTSNTSDTWLFRLFDNGVYPATYNYNETAMENTIHSIENLSGDNSYVKIRLYNVTNTKFYGIYEVMANISTGIAPMRVYYCNSSYTTANPVVSPDCVLFYTLNTTAPFNHTHTIYSSHHTMPFAINTTTGQIGDVYVTPTSYFLLRGDINTSWNVFYITNISNSDTIQTTTDNGTTWVNFAGTVDSHLHQYDGADAFYSFVQACDTLGQCTNSSLRQDSIDLGGLPPTASDVYNPTLGTYSGLISINYTAAISPNGFDIALYNISLIYTNFTYVQTIVANNSPNLNYLWNSAGVHKGNNYKIQVHDCDINGLCSDGFSEIFGIDNTPQWSNRVTGVVATYSPTTNSTFGINWSGAQTVYIETNVSGSSQNFTMTNVIGNNYTFSIIARGGDMYWKTWANNSLNEWNVSDTLYFTIDPAPSTITMKINNTNGDVTTKAGTINFTVELNTAGTVFLYQNGVQIATGAAPLTNLSQYSSTGTFNISANWSGNNNYTSAQTYHILTIDANPPQLNFETPTPPDGSTIYGSSITVNVTSNEALYSCILNWNGVNESMTLTPGDFLCHTSKTGLSSGNYTFLVYGTDAVGNLNKTETRTITIVRTDGASGSSSGQVISLAEAFTFNITPTSFSKQLAAGVIYRDSIKVVANKYGRITATIACEEGDESCRWVVFINNATGGFLSNDMIMFTITADAPERDVPIAVQIPDSVISKSYKFKIIFTNGDSGLRKELTYELTVAPPSTLGLTGFTLGFSNFYNSPVLQSSKGPTLYGYHIVWAVITVIIIIGMYIGYLVIVK
jgi:hypothetical protein